MQDRSVAGFEGYLLDDVGGNAGVQAEDALLDALADVCRVCGVPALARCGIEEAAFFAAIDKMASDAIASGSPANCYKAVTAADCARLYRTAWEAGR